MQMCRRDSSHAGMRTGSDEDVLDPNSSGGHRADSVRLHHPEKLAGLDALHRTLPAVWKGVCALRDSK